MHFHLCLRFPYLRFLHLCTSRIMCPWFYCLCISFLYFSLIRRSFFTHVLPLPSLHFLHGGIKSAHTPRKSFLKSCELSSVPLSLRAVCQSIPYTNSLSKWKCALLKSVLALLLIWPASFKVVNSIRAWSLQPRVPPVLTCLISSFMFVIRDRSSNASLLVGLSYVMD